jgi:hypothetical protein
MGFCKSSGMLPGTEPPKLLKLQRVLLLKLR